MAHVESIRHDAAASDIRRIKGELIAALSLLTCVRRIDSFGSVAAGRTDQWSDLDLLVSCEVPEYTAWLAAGAIRSTKRVAFYRMFTDMAQPSGRYWFCDESPFHRLDVSFYSPAAYATICESMVHAGHSIAVRSEYCAHVPPDPSVGERLHLWADLVDATASETPVGKLLYVHLETAKAQLRGLSVNRNTLETRAALLDAVAAQTLAGSAALVCFVAYIDEFIQGISN